MATPLLVSPEWLAEHLGDPRVRIVDVRWYLTERGRGRKEYLEAHIPGAVYLDVDDDLAAKRGQGPGRHPLPTPEAFAAVASNVGIGPDTHVVAYDSNGGAYAARVWWLLRYFGHEHVSLLDGGWMEWLARGYLTESDAPPVRPAQFTARPRSELVIDANTVEALRHDPKALLLDARAAERYEGRIEPMDSRAGHIPGAKSAPFAANVREDGSFKSAEELQARYEELGAGQAETIVCYCGSGVTAAHNVFALQLAGFPDALLYEGSWSDWSSDPERPAATGTEPG